MKSFFLRKNSTGKMLPNVKPLLSKTNSVDSTTSSTSIIQKANNDPSSSDDAKSDIVKCGYLRKFKTMKKKFFVLRAESDTGPARLEYYDNEKRMKSNPKRSIVLQACFNINKKMDSKHKLAIALYTKDDCFSIVPETEAELEDWLTWLLALQQGQVTQEGNITTIAKEAQPKPNFEFMWQITVKSKGLASKCPELCGQRRLCLTSTNLSLVPMSDGKESLDFPLIGIRRCGHSDCFFFMETGRNSITGAGEIWMQTEDTVIAQNMHETILNAMKHSRAEDEFGPIFRPRSASTSENGRSHSSRQGSTSCYTGTSLMGSSGSITGTGGGSNTSVSGSVSGSERNSVSSVSGGAALVQAMRERCDSMPTRSRTVSEGHRDLGPRPHFELGRPHSTCTYGHLNNLTACSPPIGPNPLSPSSGGYSDSAGSSLSIDEFENDFHHRYLSYPLDGPHLTEPTIAEEDYCSMALGQNMTDSGVDDDSRFSAIYSTSSTISVASSATSTASDYLTMNSVTKNTKVKSPPSSLNLTLTKAAGQPSVSKPSVDSSVTVGEALRSNNYVDMASPQSNSSNANADYFSMSPSLPVDDSHPKKETTGYVKMAPGGIFSSNDNISSSNPYLCMGFNSSLPKSIPRSGPPSDYVEHMSSPRSNHSFQESSLSCSPADAEFPPLEKVRSFLSEDEEYSLRPARAYSLGCRPQLETCKNSDDIRGRAFSTGSQALRQRRIAGSPLASGTNLPSVPGIDRELGVPKTLDSKVSKKSSSAPILPNIRNWGSRFNKIPVSKSSESREENHMEIVFKTSGSHDKRRFSVGSHRQKNNNRQSPCTSNVNPNEVNKTNQLATQPHEQSHPSKCETEIPQTNSKVVEKSTTLENPYINMTGKICNEIPVKTLEHNLAKTTDQISNHPSDQIPSKSSLQPSEIQLDPKTKKDKEEDEYVLINTEYDPTKAVPSKISHCQQAFANTRECNETKENVNVANHSYVNYPSRQDTKRGKSSDYFEMNHGENTKNKIPEKYADCQTNSNFSVSPKLPVPSVFKKKEEDVYCPASSCAIPIPINLTKKVSAASDSTTLSDQVTKGQLASSSNSLPGAQKLDRLNSVNAENYPNIVKPAMTHLFTEASYENIKTGPPSISPRNSKVFSNTARGKTELNYAKLQFATPSDGEEKVPKTSITTGNGSAVDCQPISAIENSVDNNSCTCYSEIDIERSRGLKYVSDSVRDGRV